MRSELISEAMSQVPNRYLLAKLLAKATRSFHRPGCRIQDTTNDVLARISRSDPIADAHPVQVPSSSAWRSGPGRKILYASNRSALRREVKPSNASLEAI
jgi:hypothetical protein